MCDYVPILPNSSQQRLKSQGESLSKQLRMGQYKEYLNMKLKTVLSYEKAPVMNRGLLAGNTAFVPNLLATAFWAHRCKVLSGHSW